MVPPSLFFTNQDAVSAALTIVRLAAPLIAAIPPSPEEKLVLDIYSQLQQGRIDRALFAPNLIDYFSPEAITDFQNSLAPLGEPLLPADRNRTARWNDISRFDIVYP